MLSKALDVALDLAAVTALAVFGWCVWPPVALLVLGLACLAMSYRRS